MANKRIRKRKIQYELNKSLKVGDKCVCPICGSVFIKKQYSQVFCDNECKVKYWNNKQRGKRNDYYSRYNMKHPQRLERIGIYKENGEFGYYDDNCEFRTFREDAECIAMCDNPILGI